MSNSTRTLRHRFVTLAHFASATLAFICIGLGVFGVLAGAAGASKPYTISRPDSRFPDFLDNGLDFKVKASREDVLEEMENLLDEGGGGVGDNFGAPKPSGVEFGQKSVLGQPALHENPDIYLNTPQLIEKYGYGPAEVHYVTTQDGYILQMHRISHGRIPDKLSQSRSTDKNPRSHERRVVFLQHGMFGTSADWVLNSVDKSLAYMLADQGYDVWLGNARGNAYSSRHVTLPPNSYKFWKFSWHEMGVFDLPAEIDYVLAATNSTSIYYVGHSMGTTMFFVLMASRPEYNAKVKVMAALGPAVYLNSTKCSIKVFANWWGPAEKLILDTIGHGVLLPKLMTALLHKFAPEFCTEDMKKDRLCEDIMSILTGYDSAQTNYTQLPVILAHEPSTVSSGTAFHYFQSIRTGDFRLYNNGFGKLPPKYDLSRVGVPVALFWGQNDILCTPIDVARLARTLPHVVLNFKVNFTLFDHVDFIFAKDVDVLVNRPLIKFLEGY